MMSSARPDRGYSWVIAACCAFLHLALFGLFRSSGALFAALLRHGYGHGSREAVAWPFVICAATFQLTAPVASVVSHYASERCTFLLGSAIATLGLACCFFANDLLWINVCFGLVHGLGFGIVITLVPVILNQYFVRYRATAMGLAFSGGTIGSLLLPRLLEFLVDKYGLRGCFLLVSGLVMHALVASALLRPPPWRQKKGAVLLPPEAYPSTVECGTGVQESEEPVIKDVAILENGQVDRCQEQEKGQEKDGVEQTDKLLSAAPLPVVVRKKPEVVGEDARSGAWSVLRDPAFHLITVSMAVFFVGVHSFFMIIVDFAADKGIPEADSSSIVAVFSATDLAGRACLGWVTDGRYLQRRQLVLADLAAIGLLNQLYPLAPSLPWMLAVAAAHGLAVGTCIPLFFVLQVEYLGLQRLTLVVALSSFINGLFTFVRPSMTGLFRDVIGSYDWMFHFLGAMSFAASLLWLTEPWLLRNRRVPPTEQCKGSSS